MSVRGPISAGLSTDSAAMSQPWASGDDVVKMVRAIVQAVSGVCTGLSSGVEQFDSDSTRALANLSEIRDPDDLARLLHTRHRVGVVTQARD